MRQHANNAGWRIVIELIVIGVELQFVGFERQLQFVQQLVESFELLEQLVEFLRQLVELEQFQRILEFGQQFVIIIRFGRFQRAEPVSGRQPGRFARVSRRRSAFARPSP